MENIAHILNETLNEVAEHVEQDEPRPHIFLFLSVTFTLGALIKNAMAHSKIPYTIVMFLVGIIAGRIGIAHDGFREHLAIENIPPEYIFYIFFPILIFQGAFEWEMQVFREVFPQTLVLAFPGLCIATLLSAITCKYIMYTEWSWTIALLYGSIISATDPVATVAMMKQLGVSRYLVGMIDGEALMNDGSAIVIYAILLPSVQERTTDNLSVGSVVEAFFRLVFGAVALGGGLGFAMVEFLEFAHSDAPLKATMTLSVSVLVFYLADYSCDFCGVLALVACGLAFSYRRFTMIPQVAHVVHNFWDILVYMANTLIFTLVGVLVALEAFDHVEWEDLGNLFILYVAIHVGRAAMLILCWPFLNMKHNITWEKIVFCSFTGLRGAVGLTLALAINQDERIDVLDRRRILFLTAGIVILTIVVNGLFGLILVDVLNLAVKNSERRTIMNVVIKSVRESMRVQMHEHKTDDVLHHCNWTAVRHDTVVVDPYNKHPLPYILHNNRVRIAHRAYLRRIMSVFLSRFEHRQITGRALGIVLGCIEHRMHRGEVVTFEDDIKFMWTPLGTDSPFWSSVISPIYMLAPGAKRKLRRRHIEICLGYRDALEDIVHHFLSTIDRVIGEELQSFARGELVLVEEELRIVKKETSSVDASIKSQLASQRIVTRGIRRLKELEEQGIIPSTDADVILESLMDISSNVFRSTMPGDTKEEVAFTKLEFLRTLSLDEKKRLYTSMKKRQYSAGDDIIISPEEVAIVYKGLVLFSRGLRQMAHGEGYIINWAMPSLTTPEKLSAVEDATLFVLSKAILRILAAQHFQVETALWTTCGAQESMHLLHNVEPFSMWGEHRLVECSYRGYLFEVEDGLWDLLSANARFVLLQGQTVDREFSSGQGSRVLPRVNIVKEWVPGTLLYVVPLPTEGVADLNREAFQHVRPATLSDVLPDLSRAESSAVLTSDREASDVFSRQTTVPRAGGVRRLLSTPPKRRSQKVEQNEIAVLNEPIEVD